MYHRKRIIATQINQESKGLEGRASEDDHQSLRLWLRLLSCSTEIKTEIGRRLRSRFGISLARFDYLAQLQRFPKGLTMNALSRYLMVTSGNITGLTDELEREGLVQREASLTDRRSYTVKLTKLGQKSFEKISYVHEGWVIEFFTGLKTSERTVLNELLGQLRIQLSDTLPKSEPSRTQSNSSVSRRRMSD